MSSKTESAPVDGSERKGQAGPAHDSAAAEAKGAGATQSEPQCPICAFIEAGPCKVEHQEWSKCRDECKKQGRDYVDDCQPLFTSFLECTLKNKDYYGPFLEMMLGEEEDEEQAAAAAGEAGPMGAAVGGGGDGAKS